MEANKFNDTVMKLLQNKVNELQAQLIQSQAQSIVVQSENKELARRLSESEMTVDSLKQAMEQSKKVDDGFTSGSYEDETPRKKKRRKVKNGTTD